jgi:hypothetical protein
MRLAVHFFPVAAALLCAMFCPACGGSSGGVVAEDASAAQDASALDAAGLDAAAADAAAQDASTRDAGPRDSGVIGPITCGSMTCAASQYCVLGCSGVDAGGRDLHECVDTPPMCMGLLTCQCAQPCPGLQICSGGGADRQFSCSGCQ